MRSAITPWCVVLSAFLAPIAGAAPISYSGGAYTQSFDGLPATGAATLTGIGPHDLNGVAGSTGLSGWTISNFAGSSTDTEFRAQDGSLSGSTGRGVVSFGASGSGERALGVLATSNQLSRFGVAFVNNSGAPITGFSLNFTGEEWRRGDVAAPGDAITYDYAVTSDGSATINTANLFTNFGSFSSPNNQASPLNVGLNGNAGANQIAVSALVNSLSWGAGQTLLIRFNGQDVTGQDNGLAVDSLTFAAVPEPSSLLLGVAAMTTFAGLKRLRHRAVN